MYKTLFALAVLAFAYFTPAYSISVEKDLSLTFSEKQGLNKFRERVAPLLKYDYMKLDIYLVRWLRARDFRLDAAESLLKRTLNWRKEQNIDNILKEDFSDIVTDFPASMDTYDKEGRPILVFDAANWNVRRAVMQGRGQRLLRFATHNIENITQQVFERQLNGQNVTQWIFLADADGFNVVEHVCASCIPLWLQIATIIDNYYNGYMDEFIVIRGPPASQAIFSIIKPVVSRQSRETFRLFGSNQAEWMKYLDDKISRSERYPRYGGTKTLDF